ncbi:transporter substrate-binding domain-containing protein [uncultured Pseudomonas sp.]|uniref:ATP-binding protein n=1 Tax=uncultured Pseudomonas sp. TaxID=114707 RepID=UPI00258B3C4C|nr:transporter substrate-binding domain-containing protein [uncultured Pseudomonas sp.]
MFLRALLIGILGGLGYLPTCAAVQLHARPAPQTPPPVLDNEELRWLWEHRVLRLGVIARDNPPFDMLTTGQAYEGITADYVGLLASQLRLEVQLQVFASFAETAAALRQGRIDLLGSVSPQQALEAGLHLSAPYAQDRPLLIAPQEHARERARSGASFRLALVDGYRPRQQVQALYPLAEIQLHPSPFSALAALALGDADLYLGSTLGSRYLLGRNQWNGAEEIGHAALTSQAVGFAMARDNKALIGLVDRVLDGLGDQHADIHERWHARPAAVHRSPGIPLSDVERHWLAENPRIKVLVNEQAMPLSYRDGKGQLQGLSFDLLQLLGRRTGLEFDIEAGGTTAQMVEQVRMGKAQLIAGLPYSPARGERLRFTRGFLSSAYVLVMQGHAERPGDLAQLNGRRLALEEGSVAQALLAQAYPRVVQSPVNGALEAVHAVAAGRVAAAVLPLVQARLLVARWYPGRLRISSLALPAEHFAFASSPGAVHLQSILDKALLDLAPREIDVLVRRWRSPLIVAASAWQRYRTPLLLGFLAAFAALLVALLWIRYLRRLQVQLRRAKQGAEAASHAKTHFLAAMSHEIRTPLHALLGMLELAQRKAGRGVLDHLAIEVAADAARGLQELIGDILDVTRIEAGELQLTPAVACLREQVSQVIQLFDHQARVKGLRLDLTVEGEVDRPVLLDPVRLRQVLANLLSNAIKFTQQGRVQVSVCAQSRSDCLVVRLIVEDTGIGIAKAELAELGQPFRQASNQSQSPRSSTGLGLGICRSLCQMMGGNLQLSSELGKGTQAQIYLELPIHPQFPSEPVVAPRSDVPSDAVPLRVLVADDYPANRLLLAQQLDYLGHHARVAEDGAQALRLWLNEHFDVVISDCSMPRLDGYGLARAIRLHERRNGGTACRLVGLTASALADERRRCLAAGMDDCLFKPLGLQALIGALGGSVAQQGKCLGDEGARTSIFDFDHLRQLADNDQGALEALLADLRRSNRDDLTRLADSGDDPKALAALAHRVKGGARILRAGDLINACERLEGSCASAPLDLERLRRDAQALHAVMQDLEHYLGSRTQG